MLLLDDLRFGNDAAVNSSRKTLTPVGPPGDVLRATAHVTEEDVFVLGLRRSGIHALMTWLPPKFGGTTLLINDHDLRFGPQVDPLDWAPTFYLQSRQGAASEVLPAAEFSRAAGRCMVSSSDDFIRTIAWWLRPIARSVLRKYRRHLRERSLRSEALPFPPEILLRTANRNVFVLENLSVADFAANYPRWREEVYLPCLATRGLKSAPRADNPNHTGAVEPTRECR